jgi:hypothetical protein
LMGSLGRLICRTRVPRQAGAYGAKLSAAQPASRRPPVAAAPSPPRAPDADPRATALAGAELLGINSTHADLGSTPAAQRGRPTHTRRRGRLYRYYICSGPAAGATPRGRSPRCAGRTARPRPLSAIQTRASGSRSRRSQSFLGRNDLIFKPTYVGQAPEIGSLVEDTPNYGHRSRDEKQVEIVERQLYHDVASAGGTDGILLAKKVRRQPSAKGNRAFAARGD